MSSIYLSGLGVSRGIATGPAHILAREQPAVSQQSLDKNEIAGEIKRFHKALKQASRQLHDIRKRIAKDTPEDIVVFIDTHLLMMEDPAFNEGVVQHIKSAACNAEWALHQQSERLIQVFEEMDDPYLKTRKDDVLHVVNRILKCLTGIDDTRLDELELKGHIIVADDLSPADTIMYQHQKIAGFITEFGGPLSHTAILARSLGIPAVVGLHHARQLIREGEILIVDGSQGTVVNSPDEASLRHYRKLRRKQEARRRQLGELSGKPAVSHDGVEISLHSNIDRPEDIRIVRKYDHTGIGLYRTEMLYIERNEWPDEATHFKTYKRAVSALKGKPLTIRTMDLGADKEIRDTLDHGPMAHNPAMGLRAIRRCLKQPQAFMPQLLAILRVSALGPVRLLIPMLTSVEEIQQLRGLLYEARAQLRKRRLAFDENLPVGAMIEVPSAALGCEAFARELDFLSIGTNDLIQYTLAIDRVDEEVNYLYNPAHPAVLKLIDMVIQAGARAGIPVSMCGEMASDARYTRLLLGMGLKAFSVQANALLEIKHIILNSHIEKLRKQVAPILALSHSHDIDHAIDALNASQEA